MKARIVLKPVTRYLVALFFCGSFNIDWELVANSRKLVIKARILEAASEINFFVLGFFTLRFNLIQCSMSMSDDRSDSFDYPAGPDHTFRQYDVMQITFIPSNAMFSNHF